MFNALWDLPIGEEEDRGGQAGQGGGWLTRPLSHIELAPIVTVESGRPVNPLNGLDSNQNHAFPLSSRPLTPRQKLPDLALIGQRGFSRTEILRVRRSEAPGPGDGILQLAEPRERFQDGSGVRLRFRADTAIPTTHRRKRRPASPVLAGF